MYLIDIIPLTKIPHTLPQILSYFFGQKLPDGALVQIPLGRRKENGVVIGVREISDYKMEIKKADFELRKIDKIISSGPILTKQQIGLALFLGQYYFCSPGIFAKICLPKSINNQQLTTNNKNSKKIRKQTLILAPTVSQAHLSYGTHLSDKTIIWHSELTQKQKNAAWLTIKTGQAKTIIGTRSAVFLPFNNLRQISILDESNPNHKSWDMFPRYDSRVIARKLAENFKARLSSSHKFQAVRQPEIKPTIIDMRAELRAGNFSVFSRDLHNAINEALIANKQTILFINRRGAANFLLCRDCGYIAKCVNCDAPMAYHLINGSPSLLCHRCGAKSAIFQNCPQCHGYRIKTVGLGAQKAEAAARKAFPQAKIARLDSDNAPKPKDRQKIITDFTGKKIDILITTQIIFSWLGAGCSEFKAPDALKVIGILSADTLLHIPDFRSGERTFQTIRALQSLQNVVASAAPRLRDGAKQSRNVDAIYDDIAASPTTTRNDAPDSPFKKGGVEGILNQKQFIIQTYNPESSVLKYVRDNDYEGFMKEEMDTRQALNYPPFSQIVKLTFRHRDAQKTAQEAKILAAKLNNVISSSPALSPSRNREGEMKRGWTASSPIEEQDGRFSKKQSAIQLSPAIPAFIPRERGQFVWNIIIKLTSPEVIPSEARNPMENRKPYLVFSSPEFLRRRNSLLQYVPQNWEINVDPENLL